MVAYGLGVTGGYFLGYGQCQDDVAETSGKHKVTREEGMGIIASEANSQKIQTV